MENRVPEFREFMNADEAARVDPRSGLVEFTGEARFSEDGRGRVRGIVPLPAGFQAIRVGPGSIRTELRMNHAGYGYCIVRVYLVGNLEALDLGTEVPGLLNLSVGTADQGVNVVLPVSPVVPLLDRQYLVVEVTQGGPRVAGVEVRLTGLLQKA